MRIYCWISSRVYSPSTTNTVSADLLRFKGQTWSILSRYWYTTLWSLVVEPLTAGGKRRRENLFLNVMRQTALRGTFLGLKIRSLEQTSLPRLTQYKSLRNKVVWVICQKQMSIYFVIHTQSSRLQNSLGGAESQPTTFFLSSCSHIFTKAREGSVTSSRCASDKSL